QSYQHRQRRAPDARAGDAHDDPGRKAGTTGEEGGGAAPRPRGAPPALPRPLTRPRPPPTLRCRGHDLRDLLQRIGS
ncbi:unnamed protein product, partial [Prorocentrum cordatum]